VRKSTEMVGRYVSDNESDYTSDNGPIYGGNVARALCLHIVFNKFNALAMELISNNAYVVQLSSSGNPPADVGTTLTMDARPRFRRTQTQKTDLHCPHKQSLSTDYQRRLEHR